MAKLKKQKVKYDMLISSPNSRYKTSQQAARESVVKILN